MRALQRDGYDSSDRLQRSVCLDRGRMAEEGREVPWVQGNRIRLGRRSQTGEVVHLMYRSVTHAVWSMVRWQERRRAAKVAPFPDHIPKGTSMADPWAYLHVHATRGVTRLESEHLGDPETVMLLFERFDRYRYLTRLILEHKSPEAFPGRERGRAYRTLARFARELCWRGLLDSPPETCNRNLHGEFPGCRHGCRTGERFPLTQ